MNKFAIVWLALFPAANFLIAQSSSYPADIAAHRERYKQEFLEEPRAPLTAADTALLDFFPADENWRITARFAPTPEAKPFDMPTYAGKVARYVQYGNLYFTIDGQEYTLQIFQSMRLMQKEGYRDYLFLPFKDLSNGDDTYGGGRYLDLRFGDIREDQTMILDFNTCYNPWCAYSDGYSCPIPPRDNHLDIAIPAGEKLFKGARKH